VAGYGSYNNTNDQISFGDHTERFAYYGSFSGYRTDLGLETPIPRVIHDQAAGLGGFASLIFNKTPTDQLRLITSVRGDHYQVPQDPNASADEGFVGIGDVEDERDVLVNFSWLHTAGPGLVFTISPFYHFNRAHYIGGPLDQAVSPEDDRGSNYFGGVVSLAWIQPRHTLRTGIQVFGQRDNELFAIASSDPTLALAPQRRLPWGSLATYFLEDQFKLTSWLTLNGGVRLTHFEAGVSENAADPRIGAAVRIPRLNWVARAFYGRYYQAPPLLTVGGPLIDLCSQQDCGFLPLHGERDEQHEFGLTIPFAGWTFDVANFRTGARNFFDHDALGNSNIFFPLTLERGRIRGWETTATSPRIAGRAQFHLAYSHQHAQWSGGITGGLITDESCEEPLCFLDHDQRDAFTTGVNLALPWRAWMDFNVNRGSGFLDGEGPQHLPAHTTYDVSLGKSFGESWSVRFTALNLANNRYLLDNANTFGGTHYSNPLELSGQIRYRFHF
jgi:outer membrane receptor protein involved in Fe transport